MILSMFKLKISITDQAATKFLIQKGSIILRMGKLKFILKSRNRL